MWVPVGRRRVLRSSADKTVKVVDSLDFGAYSPAMPDARSLGDTYVSIPELMRLARGSYKRAVDAQYAARGIDDFPNPGGYVLSYLVNGEDSVPDMIEGLGIGRRQYDRVVDLLVLRGYLTREIDPSAGTASLALSERGRAAAEAIVEGSRLVDEELARRLSEDEIAAMRKGLLALGEIKRSLPKP
jgi:DNA-binding MarR family transcriptional regulator